MDEFLRIFLPVYFFAFLAVAVFLRSLLVWKRTGVNPYRLRETEGVQGFIGSVFRLTFVLILATIIGFSFFSPESYQYTGRLVWLENFWAQTSGLFLLATSLVWITIAQTQMGESWRIGVDRENRTELVSGGLFGVSRNPIFFGMRLALLGFFLTMPNAFTLLALGIGDVLLQIQVRFEEEHLTDLHGERYLDYKRKVRRWI